MNGGKGTVLAGLRGAGSAPATARRRSSSLTGVWPAIAGALAALEGLLIGTVGVTAVELSARTRSGVELVAVGVTMAAPLVVASLWVSGRYRLEQLASFRSAVGPVIWRVLLGLGLTLLTIRLAAPASAQARLWAVVAFTSGGAAMLLYRATVALWLRRQLARGRLLRRVVVLAPPASIDGAALARDLAAARGQPCKLHRLDLRALQAPPSRAVEAAALVASRVSALEPDEILLVANTPLQAPPIALQPALPGDALLGLQRLPWPTTLACPRPGADGGFALTTLMAPPLTDAQRVAKRAFDLLGASALLILLLPAFALIAVLIKIDSPGPILFRQQRRGLHNEIFEVLKFRSMRVAVCDPLAQRLTLRNDPRVTRVGAFLRRWSMDELPQLLNVIEGSMSLVGPRPHPLRAKAGERLYEDVVADFALRYRVKPGITGWAQVNGLRGNTDSEQKLVRRFEYDMEYIRRWSLWLDLQILLRTPLVSLFGENAY